MSLGKPKSMDLYSDNVFTSVGKANKLFITVQEVQRSSQKNKNLFELHQLTSRHFINFCFLVVQKESPEEMVSPFPVINSVHYADRNCSTSDVNSHKFSLCGCNVHALLGFCSNCI